MKSSEIRETDLYQPIYDYLTHAGYRVRSEVVDCDITAIKGDELIIVELKCSFNLELLIQGTLRQKLADSVYVAVPKPKRGIINQRWKSVHHLLRRLELGLIFVSFTTKTPTIEIALDPAPFDRYKSIQQAKRKRMHVIKESEDRIADYNVGGSKGRKLMTAYRESAIQVATLLSLHEQLSPKSLQQKGASIKTPAILQDNHYGWFERVSRGVYRLSDQGNQALLEFPALVQYYKQQAHP